MHQMVRLIIGSTTVMSLISCLQREMPKPRKQVVRRLTTTTKIADAAIVYPIVDNKKILVINKDVKGANEAKNLPIYTFADWSKLSK